MRLVYDIHLKITEYPRQVLYDEPVKRPTRNGSFQNTLGSKWEGVGRDTGRPIKFHPQHRKQGYRVTGMMEPVFGCNIVALVLLLVQSVPQVVTFSISKHRGLKTFLVICYFLFLSSLYFLSFTTLLHSLLLCYTFLFLSLLRYTFLSSSSVSIFFFQLVSFSTTTEYSH